MKAIVCTRYGPPEVVEVREVPVPNPKANEVRVRVRATTVTRGDARIRSFDVPSGQRFLMRLAVGYNGPRRSILGFDFAGEVETVGSGVTRFKTGDRVFGNTQWMKFGAHAEYVCVPESTARHSVLARIPAGVSYVDAAGVPFMGLSALYFLKRGKIDAGQNVLVIGASGSVGTYAIQLAKYFGAEVTGTCRTQNLDLVRSIGADHVIDYTKEQCPPVGDAYDLVFDTVGKGDVVQSAGALTGDGRLVLANPGPGVVSRARKAARGTRRSVVAGTAHATDSDLEYFAELLETGEIRSVIDKVFTINEAVSAHRHVDTGHKRGNVVIAIANSE